MPANHTTDPGTEDLTVAVPADLREPLAYAAYWVIRGAAEAIEHGQPEPESVIDSPEAWRPYVAEITRQGVLLAALADPSLGTVPLNSTADSVINQAIEDARTDIENADADTLGDLPARLDSLLRLRDDVVVGSTVTLTIAAEHAPAVAGALKLDLDRVSFNGIPREDVPAQVTELQAALARLDAIQWGDAAGDIAMPAGWWAELIQYLTDTGSNKLSAAEIAAGNALASQFDGLIQGRGNSPETRSGVDALLLITATINEACDTLGEGHSLHSCLREWSTGLRSYAADLSASEGPGLDSPDEQA